MLQGGESTTEEMCLAFLRYYPKSPLSNCGSVFRLPEYLDMLGTISNKRYIVNVSLVKQILNRHLPTEKHFCHALERTQ